MIDADLHFVSAIFIFIAAIIPIYLSFRLKNALRRLTIVFAIFILIHGLYHVSGSLGQEFLSESIFAPLSAFALVIFGLMYVRIPKRKDGIKT